MNTKVNIEIDIDDVLSNMDSVQRYELAYKLASDELSPSDLAELAVENSDENSIDVLDKIDDDNIVKYLEQRGYYCIEKS